MGDSALFMVIFSGGVALAACAILWLMFQARGGDFGQFDRSTQYLQTGVVALLALFYAADMVVQFMESEEGAQTFGVNVGGKASHDVGVKTSQSRLI